MSREQLSLPGGATARLDFAATAALVELDTTAWPNNTVRVLARNISNTTIDLVAATLSVQVAKRRVP